MAITELEKNVVKFRRDERFLIRSKFGNLFRSQYKIEGVTQDESEFLMKLAYIQGRVCAFRLGDVKLLGDKAPLGFGNFAVINYNRTQKPAIIRVVSENKDINVPKSPLVVGEEAFVFFSYADESVPMRHIWQIIDKLIEVEISIRSNLLLVRSNYWLNARGNTEKLKAESIINQIEKGVPLIFSDDNLDLDESKSTSGIQIVIDKLYDYKRALESEILTLIGIDSLNVDKKERVIVDEVNANNNITNIHAEMFKQRLEDFIKAINEKFGVSLKLKENFIKESVSVHEETQEEVEDGNEEL